MEKEFNSVFEIDEYLEKLITERLNFDKTNVKEYPTYYELTKKIDELNRIKYDFINGTHTNEIFHLKQKLITAKRHLATADILNKRHYWPVINHCESEINRLSNLDGNTLKLKK